METGSNVANSTTDKVKLFKEGLTLIFKKWTSFRLIVDNNPHILSEFADDEETQLEVNQMLEMVIDDILAEMKKSYGGVLEMNIADMLFAFIEEFFEVDLQDESEFDVAKSLIKLYNEIDGNKMDYLNKLKNADKTFNSSNFSIPFPISDDIKLSQELNNKLQVNETNDIDMEENSFTNTNKQNKANEPDEDGFVVAKKGKKF